jgi:hypothetical protein
VAVTAVTSVLVRDLLSPKKSPPEIPLAIICWSEPTKTWVVGHLSTFKENGSATYAATGGRLSATVNSKGLMEPPSNRPTGVDCYGKTLDQLRAMGRLIEFQRTR